MSNDVERIIVSHQRAQIQTCNILDGVLLINTLRQFLIGTHFFTKSFDFSDKLRMRLSKHLTTLGISGIQHRAISQYDTYRLQHAIAIGMHAAVHARGIVYHNTTYHGCTN